MVDETDENDAPGSGGYKEHYPWYSLKKWCFQNDCKLPGAGSIHGKRKDHRP